MKKYTSGSAALWIIIAVIVVGGGWFLTSHFLGVPASSVQQSVAQQTVVVNQTSLASINCTQILSGGAGTIPSFTLTDSEQARNLACGYSGLDSSQRLYGVSVTVYPSSDVPNFEDIVSAEANSTSEPVKCMPSDIGSKSAICAPLAQNADYATTFIVTSDNGHLIQIDFNYPGSYTEASSNLKNIATAVNLDIVSPNRSAQTTNSPPVSSQVTVPVSTNSVNVSKQLDFGNIEAICETSIKDDNGHLLKLGDYSCYYNNYVLVVKGSTEITVDVNGYPKSGSYENQLIQVAQLILNKI
jgi:hypothetical protein